MSNFIFATGTSGFIVTPFTVLTTELNAITNGSLATLGANNTQTTSASGVYGHFWFKSGGTFTPTGNANISIWYISSTDGGTTFELSTAAPSRAPDVIISLNAAAYASGNLVWSSGPVRLWATSTKILAQNNCGVTLPSTGNTLTCGPIAVTFA